MARFGRVGPGEARASEALQREVAQLAQPLAGIDDTDGLLERIGDARFVLLGEASHGTSEYYAWRAALSKRLIVEKDFSFIAVEGDWPDCHRVDRYVKGARDEGASARDVLHAFDRWPTWMWANEEVVELAEWLAEHNRGKPAAQQVGVYGLDVYSLWDSLYAVMGYLQRVDPQSLAVARRALRCFEPYGEDVREYARATRFVPNSCEDEVVGVLMHLRARALDGKRDHHAFEAEQNALVLKNAESYYRAMVRGGPDSWNIRDQHMAETLNRLVAHHGQGSKAIVWEHNTHVGDARFTDMADEGMVNVGQLVREAHRDAGVVLVGFGSYQGSVVAAREWGARIERVRVPPAREGSWESVLHAQSGTADAVLLVFGEASEEMFAPRGHRAIGVVYRPDYEALGNYVPTVLPRRYDAFVHIDRTHALHPLHVAVLEDGEVPETFPSGM